MADFFSFSYLPWYELIFRLSFAMLLGYVIGIARHNKNKPVDIRVFIIFSVSTCMDSMVGQALFFEYSGSGSVIQVGRRVAALPFAILGEKLIGFALR